MAHDVFISYSSKDKTVADAVCASLEARRIRCWIAPRDVLPGISYAEALIDGLNRSRILVLVFSANSNNSPQVMREIERAVHKGISIIPLQIENVIPTKAMEYFVSSSHWLDALTPPFENHLKKLADTVETLLANGSHPVVDESPDGEKPAAAEPRAVDKAAAGQTHTTVNITLTPNVSGAICYFAGWLSGAAFLALARGNRFILFHAWQSIIISGVATLVFILTGLIPPLEANSALYWTAELSEWVFALLVIFLWGFLMVQTYRGITVSVPLAGKLARKLAGQDK